MHAYPDFADDHKDRYSSTVGEVAPPPLRAINSRVATTYLSLSYLLTSTEGRDASQSTTIYDLRRFVQSSSCALGKAA